MSIDDDSFDIEARLAGTDLEAAFDRFMQWAYRRDADAIRAEAENEALFVKNVHLTGNQLKTETVDLIAELRRERDRLRAEVVALRKVFSAAQNLVNNSYTPSCDGDRQRWLMLEDTINAALRGEGE